MGDIELTLNIRNPSEEETDLAEAVKKKKASIETIEEAWQRVFSMKNSATETRRFKEAKAAFEDGVIGRVTPDKALTKAEVKRMYDNLVAIRRESVLEKLVEETPDNYILVDTIDKLNEMNEVLRGYDDLTAFDLETFSDKKGGALDPYVGNVAGFSVSTREINYYVPLNHEEKVEFDDKTAISVLKIELERMKSVMHNAPFDCKWFYIHYDVNLIDNLHADTQIMATALDENRSLRLKDLLTDWLHMPADNFDELFPDTDGFNKIPLKVALVYGAGDTEKTLQLFDWIMAQEERYKLERIMKLLFEIEMPVCRRFIWADLRGIKFDKEAAYMLDDELAIEIREIERQIFEYFGEEINLNSPQQKARLLFGKLGVKDLSGKKSTAADFLKRVQDEHPVVPLLLEHSAVEKLRSSFTKTLPTKVQEGGSVHPNYNTWGTVTGRFSCKAPNVQQIPAKRDEVRKLFTALGKDRILVSMDFSQIELRVLAHLANDTVLINAFLEGKDIHSTTGSLVSGIPYDQIQARKDIHGSDEQRARDNAKTVNFGIVYGMTEHALSKNLRITKEAAKKLIDDYFIGYPGIKGYMDSQKALLHKQGYVEDMFGRKRRLRHEIKSREFWRISSAERMAGNFPVQSSAGSMLKKAIVDLEDVLPALDSNIVLQVHDELIFDCPKDISRESLYAIRSTLENAVKLDVPVRSDIEIYPERWAESVSEDEWFSA